MQYFFLINTLKNRVNVILYDYFQNQVSPHSLILDSLEKKKVAMCK